MKKYYIAYGSNMHLEQMAHRCPNATVYNTGVLSGWKLIFRGSKTGAYATIIKCSDCVVPVVIWEITPLCERSLDIYEGYPIFYKKKKLTVDTEARSIIGMAYIMDTRCMPGRPSRHYVKTIWEGYKDNRIDANPLIEALAYNEMECK